MAANDARPVPRKNAAWRVYFAIRKNDGTLITSWTGADSEVSLDGAAFADCTSEATEVGTSGCGYLDLTAAEMNADEVTIKITVTNTSALPLVLTVFPEEAGDYRVADTQKVDVETIKTQALTAAAGITFGVYVGGTAAAAVASTALSTATWTGTLATNIGTTNTTVATNLDATVTSRMATYTQPTGFLAATFPATIASTTNITGGTITTVTNLTNAPTSGDLTATMKASVTAAVPTVANIADGVWDEARAGHTTAGTFGFYLDAAISGISGGSGATAQQVWEYATRTLTGAVELDSASQTQITAINTFATRMTTGLVVDGAVYQFTANMLELGPAGGAATVAVLPATGIVADRSAGTTLTPVVGETISQSITVYQSDGTTAVSLSGKTLKVIFETMSGVDVAVVLAADITISGASSNVVTFAYPSAVTASERTLRFAIRDAAAPLTMYLQGVCSVVAAPKVDA